MIEVIPRNIHKLFPNVTYLTVANCGIKKISREDFAGLENLVYLNAGRNPLTSLPDNLFADMKNLQNINFPNNKLQRLSSKLIRPIERSLTSADFRGNERTNSFFDTNDENSKNLEKFKETIDSECLPPEPDIRSQRSVTVGEFEHGLLAKFAEFRATGEYTDFTIKVHSRQFKVHKCILAAQSFVFRELFENDAVGCPNSFKNIEKFSEKAFESFLDYFYNCSIDDTVMLELFELASEFDVQKLKEKCVDKILESLNESNAPEVFKLAHYHKSDELRRPAFKIIQKMLPGLMDNFEYNLEKVNNVVALKREIDKIMEE